jgi:putative endonuclease
MTGSSRRPAPAILDAMRTHLALGRQGEQLAMRFLEKEERMLAVSRNWRCSEGELDLVLMQDGTLIFCEVKTRTSTNFGPPTDAVTPDKAHRIRRLARRWLHAYNVEHWVPIRFDLVSILWPRGQTPQVKHFPAAF